MERTVSIPNRSIAGFLVTNFLACQHAIENQAALKYHLEQSRKDPRFRYM